jgi:Domain of unknown function (DUF5069)
MEALDLRTHRPRSGWAQLDGLYMLPRTIDKMRGLLPGGNIGPYKISGFSSLVLKELDIDEDRFRDAVAAASGDDDVVRWLRENTDTAKYEAINAKLLSRTVERLSQMNPDYFINYPMAKGLPKETIHFDVLDKDDDLIYNA